MARKPQRKSVSSARKARSAPPDAKYQARRPSRYGRWRAATLASVYLLMVVHVIHWRLSGTTLAPLELNEVMYTAELGVLTAGALFIMAAVLSVMIFGRFFCSWGCHILALEDLCAWLLSKLRIRPRLVRSRVLLLVAPGAMIYMFIWPQVWRLFQGRSLPDAHVLTDAQGWGSFSTTDFWRNLPGPWVIALTFAVCGFAIVYFLGTRGFCTYACPYGVAFGFAERFAPGRIVAKGECQQCGTCTDTCKSHVQVHKEIAAFGKVVSPSCMKDLDCVSACPHGVLGYGFTRPALFKSFLSPRRPRVEYDFTVAEDALMVVVFLATLLTFRGLYVAVPFLMTLALGVILAYLAVVCVRLLRRHEVGVGHLLLKRAHQLTGAGRVYRVLMVLLAGFFIHSAWIRYHEYVGHQAFSEIWRQATRNENVPPRQVAAALGHLETCERWGLVRPIELLQRLAQLHDLGGDLQKAEDYTRRVLAQEPNDPSWRLRLGELLAGAGRLDEAAENLRLAVESRPDSVPARYNLGVVLAALGREDAAIEQYRAAVALDPNDVDVRNNLGFLLSKRGELDAAAKHFLKAIAIKPDYAHPHFNLGRLLQARGRLAEAEAQFALAARLDPQYAALLQGLQPGSP